MKVYLCFMCGPESLTNIKELIDPVRAAFDGVVAVLHDSRGSEEDVYLESVKGCGKVVHTEFVRRHDWSRNHYLYNGPMENGDWCVQIDDKERLNPLFATNLRAVIAQLKDRNLNAAWYYGKPFVFEYHESLEYRGNPHEGLRRNDGQMQGIELSGTYPVETDVRYSVRAAQRQDHYHWVGHYWRYYTFPWGSNQTLLGAEHRGNAMEVYQKREVVRAAFRDELARRGVKWDHQAILTYWLAVPLDDTMRTFVNADKVISDSYRYFVLNDLEVRDEHDWVSMKTI